MPSLRRWLIAAALLTLGMMPAQAALNVFACEPEWASLTRELGGDDVSVFTATTAQQDPHNVQARPSLIARIRTSDLVVCTGAELEIGWLPLLLRQGANNQVQPGSRGFFAAADHVRLLEVPARLDRANGDVHAAGNPHINTGPEEIRAIAVALGQRLREIDPSRAADHGRRTERFLARWDEAMARWRTQAAPLRGVNFAVHHGNWVYLMNFIGARQAVDLEPKPGVPPSAAHLASLVAEIPRRQVRAVIYTAYQDPRSAEFIATRTGVPAVQLPYTVGGNDRAGDLFGLFDDTIALLLGGLKAPVGKS